MPLRQPVGRHRRRPRRRRLVPVIRHTPAVLAALSLSTAAVGGLHVSAASGHTAARAPQRPAATAPVLARSAAAVLVDQATHVRVQQLARSRVALAARAAAVQRTQRDRADRARAERALPTFRLPAAGYRLTAGFLQAGGLWSSGHHTGQDFAAPTGTPVVAIAAGTIVSAQSDGAYGNKIVLRLTDGTVLWYCHLSGFAKSSGPVAAGEQIGFIGSTGNTTGPHLHLEVHPGDGDPVDPKVWLVGHGLKP